MSTQTGRATPRSGDLPWRSWPETGQAVSHAGKRFGLRLASPELAPWHWLPWFSGVPSRRRGPPPKLDRCRDWSRSCWGRPGGSRIHRGRICRRRARRGGHSQEPTNNVSPAGFQEAEVKKAFAALLSDGDTKQRDFEKAPDDEGALRDLRERSAEGRSGAFTTMPSRRCLSQRIVWPASGPFQRPWLGMNRQPGLGVVWTRSSNGYGGSSNTVRPVSP